MNMQSDQAVVVHTAKDVGEIARRHRKAQDLNIADLAGLANTGPRFVNDLEHGKPTVQFDKVMHILSMLGLEVMIVEKRA